MLKDLWHHVSSAFRTTVPRAIVTYERPTYTVREAVPADRAGAYTLASGIRSDLYAVSLARHCVLNDRSLCQCGCGLVVRCWVAIDRQGEIVGLAAGTESLAAVGLADIVVDLGWRRRGVGSALLRAVQDLADSHLIPTFAVVRGTDVVGLDWLCERGFETARHPDNRPVINATAFQEESCSEGIGLVRRGACVAQVRIAE